VEFKATKPRKVHGRGDRPKESQIVIENTGAMAGTDDAGAAWATSYAGRAGEVLAQHPDVDRANASYTSPANSNNRFPTA
jgi:hypothetical protein